MFSFLRRLARSKFHLPVDRRSADLLRWAAPGRRAVSLGMGLLSILSSSAFANAGAPETTDLNDAKAAGTPANRPVLRLLAYESLMGKKSAGEWLVSEFESRCACKVEVETVSEAGGLISRIKRDLHLPPPRTGGIDLVLGLDPATFEQVRQLASGGYWVRSTAGVTGLERIAPRYRPKNSEAPGGLPGTLQGYVPISVGVFALMAEMELLAKRSLKLPTRLADLLRPEYSKQFVLEDPRTSAPGLAWLQYSQLVIPLADLPMAWQGLQRNGLTLAPGWSAAYSFFTRGEVPFVWSYLTSQVYHEEKGQAGRFRALVFDEGSPYQLEGVARVQDPSPEVEKWTGQFLSFLLEKKSQEILATRNYVLPVREDVDLPKAFRTLPKPKKWLPLSTNPNGKAQLLDAWSLMVSKAHR
jgi:thiamine transport system substrate-binding protein